MKSLYPIIILFMIVSPGCKESKSKNPRVVVDVSKKTVQAEQQGNQKQSEQKQASPAAELPKRKYIYRGHEYNDPFNSMVISPVLRGKMLEQGDVNVNLDALKLTGIMTNAQQEAYALLSETGGLSYVVKQGKLYDPYGRAVPDVAAIIKKDRVVLLAGKGLMRELKLE